MSAGGFQSCRAAHQNSHLITALVFGKYSKISSYSFFQAFMCLSTTVLVEVEFCRAGWSVLDALLWDNAEIVVSVAAGCGPCVIGCVYDKVVQCTDKYCNLTGTVMYAFNISILTLGYLRESVVQREMHTQVCPHCTWCVSITQLNVCLCICVFRKIYSVLFRPHI